MTATYDKITVLSEGDHIRLRPGMYIGSTEDATHLFQEVIDNALDECMAGHANAVYVHYDATSFTVSDNGRGIPQSYNHEFKEYGPILIATKLFSGSKFNGEAYSIKAGLNGIGLTAVNYLSDWLYINTTRNQQEFDVKFKDGIPSKPIISQCGLHVHGTWIKVYPSPQYFKSVSIDPKVVTSRTRLAATFLPKVEIYVNDELTKPFTKEDFCPDADTPAIEIKIDLEDGQGLQAILAYDTKGIKTEIGQGSVNLLECNSGVHIRAFESAIVQGWRKIFDKDLLDYLDWKDPLIGAKGFIYIKVKDPKYTSQTKEVLAGSVNEYSFLIEKLSSEIAKQLQAPSFENYRKALVLKFKDYRSHLNQLSSGKFLDEVLRLGEEDDARINRGLRSDTKLIDCTSTERKSTELFIVEGDSAGGGIVSERNRLIHAVLPLRGKLLNIIDLSLDSIMMNIEIRSLVNSVGCGVRHKEIPERIRYSKIIIAADPDCDGKNIEALIVGALCYLIPKTVRAGHIFIVHAPLFGQYDKKGNWLPVWEQASLNPKLKTERYKGLGSLESDQLAEVLLNPSTRHLSKITVNDIKMVELLVGHSGARKEMLLSRGIIK
jgi:DNA gyrase/topoisomerase IV subunit B